MTAAVHPSPIYSLKANGKDITANLKGRLESLTLNDMRGFEADQLDIVLDDSDGLLNLPPRGTKLSLAFGWEATGLVDKGLYIVDELDHSGAPDKLTIRARSADLRDGLIEKRERSFDQQTLGALVGQIAKEHGLTAQLSPALAQESLDHVDQTSESDANLLTRLATEFDAIATVKNDRLLFIKAGDARTASGQPLQGVLITRQAGDQHRFNLADGQNYTAVKAYFQDTKAAEKGEVLVDIKTGEHPGETELEPSGDQTKVLRHTYASEANALRAAKAMADKLRRGVATFSITLAYGRPDLFPELPATVRGFKPLIDSTEWLIAQVTHTISDGGYTNQVEMELKLSE
ncbi:MAG: phage late control D family protein [Gammaproteobacteria bacterium]|nr:phage late control D family protein [Gammaproteobacteria bacterium]